MLLISVFYLFFLDLVEGFGMFDFEEVVLNSSLKLYSMLYCFFVLYKFKYLIRVYSYFILMRVVIRFCFLFINFIGDV